MTEFNFIILYVDNPPASAAFYADLLGKPVLDSAPAFAMLPLTGSVMLGLWERGDVQPEAAIPAGGSEFCVAVEDAATLDRLCETWKAKGVTILQAPAEMDFGRTFTIADPDGHRLRAYVPAAR